MKLKGKLKKITIIFLTATLFSFTFSDISYGQKIGAYNTSKYVGDGRYDWTVYIVADRETLGKISYVQYTLHPTFNPAVVKATNRNKPHPFSITRNGWGEFNIKVKVVFKNNTYTSFDYYLEL